MVIKIRNIIMGGGFRIINSNYELYRKRMTICNNCERRIKILGDYGCEACGCNLKAKCRVKDEKCLMNKG